MSQRRGLAPLGPVTDGEIPAFCADLGIPGLADVHTHFLPPRMQRRVWAHFDEAGPLIGTEWPIEYRWPEEARVAHLRAMGVKLFSALAYAHRPEMAADLNEWTLEFARKTPDCLPSATFYPEPAAPEYVTQALDDGARIFKIHLQVGGFSPTDPLLDPVWQLLTDARTPVVIHAGHAPVAAEHTGPEPLAELLRRHPDLTVIVAHMGAPDFAEFLGMAAARERVYLDTTMIFTGWLGQFPDQSLPALKDLGLRGKVLLGSDFPTIPYPYARQIAGLAGLQLGQDWLRAVCWDNPVAMFGEDLRTTWRAK
jgi:uncharacterized protein